MEITGAKLNIEKGMKRNENRLRDFQFVYYSVSHWLKNPSGQFSHSVVSDSLLPHGPQHARPFCPSPTPRVYSLMSIESVMPSNHLILCHPLLSCLQSFAASGRSFPMSQFFSLRGQSIGASALVNIQDWFPLGLTSLMSLQSKGLSRVFSSTTFQRH